MAISDPIADMLTRIRNANMVGHKFGEFSPTRQFSGHTPADKKAAQEAAASTSAPAPGAAPGAAKSSAPTKPKEGSSDAKK